MLGVPHCTIRSSSSTTLSVVVSSLVLLPTFQQSTFLVHLLPSLLFSTEQLPTYRYYGCVCDSRVSVAGLRGGSYVSRKERTISCHVTLLQVLIECHKKKVRLTGNRKEDGVHVDVVSQFTVLWFEGIFYILFHALSDTRFLTLKNPSSRSTQRVIHRTSGPPPLVLASVVCCVVVMTTP